MSERFPSHVTKPSSQYVHVLPKTPVALCGAMHFSSEEQRSQDNSVNCRRLYMAVSVRVLANYHTGCCLLFILARNHTSFYFTKYLLSYIAHQFFTVNSVVSSIFWIRWDRCWTTIIMYLRSITIEILFNIQSCDFITVFSPRQKHQRFMNGHASLFETCFEPLFRNLKPAMFATRLVPLEHLNRWVNFREARQTHTTMSIHMGKQSKDSDWHLRLKAKLWSEVISDNLTSRWLKF